MKITKVASDHIMSLFGRTGTRMKFIEANPQCSECEHLCQGLPKFSDFYKFVIETYCPTCPNFTEDFNWKVDVDLFYKNSDAAEEKSLGTD